MFIIYLGTLWYVLHNLSNWYLIKSYPMNIYDFVDILLLYEDLDLTDLKSSKI